MSTCYRISSIKLPLAHTKEDLFAAVRREGLRFAAEDLRIVRKSIDARDRADIRFVYTVDLPRSKTGLLKRAAASKKLQEITETVYAPPLPLADFAGQPPVVVGCGPAGLFAGLILAEAGLRPLLIERGGPVEERRADVNALWEKDCLDEDSNVCFGEGGAGTYSDGKLSTGNKDRDGRQAFILKTFADCGAPEEIRYWYQPHIGSDVLPSVVKNLRQKILDCGGTVSFHTKLTDLDLVHGSLRGITVRGPEGERHLACDSLILAAGHGADDVFTLLKDRGAALEQKPFAMGLRIEHPQTQIQLAQFGTTDRSLLPAASYKLVTHAEARNVFSFCMCPGGQVVNASTKDGQTVVNGMSLSGRNGPNANSALVVSVGPADYHGEDPLAGLAFQKRWEQAAYRAGAGGIPVQLLGDYLAGRTSQGFGDVLPEISGTHRFADLNGVLPQPVNAALQQTIHGFAASVPDYDRPDAVLSGIESRTSSPVRVVRDEGAESNIRGLFPCGEGAGYAGGIMSAAADGIKVAEEIIRRKRL